MQKLKSPRLLRANTARIGRQTNTTMAPYCSALTSYSPDKFSSNQSAVLTRQINASADVRRNVQIIRYLILEAFAKKCVFPEWALHLKKLNARNY